MYSEQAVNASCSNIRYESVTGDGIIVTDRNGTVRYINSTAETLTEWSRSEAEGKPFSDVFKLVDLFSEFSLETPIWKSLMLGKTIDIKKNSTILTKTGKLLFISASCFPIRESSGETKGVVVAFRDINHIKNEENVRNKDNNLKNIFESIPMGTLLVGEEFVVKMVNRPALNLFQVDAENIVGQRFGDGSHCVHSYEKGCGDGEACRFCEIRRYGNAAFENPANSRDVVIRKSFITDAGKINLWLKISFIPLHSFGEKQMIVAIEDITEQKNNEIMLKSNNLVSMHEVIAKDELLIKINNEIRAPLNGLIGMLDLLLMSNIDREQEEYIQMAKFSANSILKHINDAIDFPRDSTGGIFIVNTDFSLSSVIKEITASKSPLLEEKEINLEFSLSKEIPDALKGDSDRIRQILNILINGASRFLKSGKINVAADILEKDEENFLLEFYISCEGLLFNKNLKNSSSEDLKDKYDILELFSCRQIAGLMGGDVTACLSPDKGISFRFFLKVRKSNSKAKEKENNAENSSLNFTLPKSCRRVSLSENGSIVFGPEIKELPSKEDAALFEKELSKLHILILEKNFDKLEDAASRVKAAAISAKEFSLADFAFKAQLAARKHEFDVAAKHCLEMIKEFGKHHKEVSNENSYCGR